MKRVALLTDVSGLGNCSGCANVAVLSSLGLEPCLLPTAVLSAQTGFSEHTFFTLEDEFCESCRSLVALSPTVSAVYLGFFASSRQLEAAATLAEHFGKSGAAVVLDPIIGDGGKRFPFISDEHFETLCNLARRSDVITPNITEFCLISGADYAALSSLGESERIDKLCTLCREYVGESDLTVVITGVGCGSKIAVIAADRSRTTVHYANRHGGSYSGTGDIFTSMLCAAAANKSDLHIAAEKAAQTISEILRESSDSISDRNFGIPFQRYLSKIAAKNL